MSVHTLAVLVEIIVTSVGLGLRFCRPLHVYLIGHFFAEIT